MENAPPSFPVVLLLKTLFEILSSDASEASPT
jgi:hypothetical protein